MAANPNPTRKKDSFDVFCAKLTAAIAGLEANVAATSPVQLKGQSRPSGGVGADLQAFVDQNTAANKAWAEAVTLSKARKASRRAAELELAALMKWAVVTYGDQAYEMFGQAPPRTPVQSVATKAIAAEKRKAIAKAKAKAKAAIAPPTERLIAFDASGKPIGGDEVLPAILTKSKPTTSG